MYSLGCARLIFFILCAMEPHGASWHSFCFLLYKIRISIPCKILHYQNSQDILKNFY